MSTKANAHPKRGRAPASVLPRRGPQRVFDVDRYGGKVVATIRGEVVAEGDTFAEVDREIRRLHLESEAILTRVPARGELFL